MIDIHAHILPGIDDGPKTMEDSLSLLRYAKDNGVKEIIATPHYRPPKYQCANIKSIFEELKTKVEQEGLGLNIFLGSEIYLEEEWQAGLMSGKCSSMGGSSYLLVELPRHKIYPYHEKLLYEIQLQGFQIILAHIERFDYLIKEPDLLQTLKDRGYYMQLNASSLMDRRTKKTALNLLWKGVIHFIASDSHNLLSRKPQMREAYTLVQDELGIDAAELLFRKNGAKLIANEPIVDLKTEKKTHKGMIGRLLAPWK
ncbi:tyrosine-protein phosphatase [Dehalobacterium formicoaceticum]|uniref:tyrosine-protein phosphatase n=1 Tax=Dehalobacterium formicoaceticum TaxID=51515 RepID=UPI000B7D136C|nr:CpsB/CapC family capsule biosynthesis tyrosine phosphatase [Dehalobacterium formicoaceticum]